MSGGFRALGGMQLPNELKTLPLEQLQVRLRLRRRSAAAAPLAPAACGAGAAPPRGTRRCSSCAPALHCSTRQV